MKNEVEKIREFMSLNLELIALKKQNRKFKK